MKTILSIILLSFSVFASAEVCTSVIKDQYGYEYESYTRSSYSQAAACDQANYDCRNALSYAQSYGRYQNAFCEVKYNSPFPNPYPNPNPYPYPQNYICQSDLVDYYGRLIQSYTAPGANEREACYSVDNICRNQLGRAGNGARCINRGLIDNRNDPRPPMPQTKSAQCSANRYDPAGMFIQSYMASATGPINSDVLGAACNRAFNVCSRDLRGRQFCNIAR